MIFIVTVSFLWAGLLTLFVLSPMLGSTKKLLLTMLVTFAVTLIALQYYNSAFAQETKSAVAPANVVIPPPTILPESGYWVPAVNQFILVPAQGLLHVYYVGMFANIYHAKGTKILLPFPKNIKNVSIRTNESASLDTFSGESNRDIILNTSLQDNTNQIQAEFTLPASTGVVSWKKSSLNFLPGVTIIMMSAHPASFINFPKDFKSLPGGEIQFVRVGNSSTHFPEFKIVGLLPTRNYLYFIVIFFACVFFASLFFSNSKLKS